MSTTSKMLQQNLTMMTLHIAHRAEGGEEGRNSSSGGGDMYRSRDMYSNRCSGGGGSTLRRRSTGLAKFTSVCGISNFLIVLQACGMILLFFARVILFGCSKLFRWVG